MRGPVSRLLGALGLGVGMVLIGAASCTDQPAPEPSGSAQAKPSIAPATEPGFGATCPPWPWASPQPVRCRTIEDEVDLGAEVSVLWQDLDVVNGTVRTSYEVRTLGQDGSLIRNTSPVGEHPDQLYGTTGLAQVRGNHAEVIRPQQNSDEAGGAQPFAFVRLGDMVAWVQTHSTRLGAMDWQVYTARDNVVTRVATSSDEPGGHMPPIVRGDPAVSLTDHEACWNAATVSPDGDGTWETALYCAPTGGEAPPRLIARDVLLHDGDENGGLVYATGGEPGGQLAVRRMGPNGEVSAIFTADVPDSVRLSALAASGSRVAVALSSGGQANPQTWIIVIGGSEVTGFQVALSGIQHLSMSGPLIAWGVESAWGDPHAYVVNTETGDAGHLGAAPGLATAALNGTLVAWRTVDAAGSSGVRTIVARLPTWMTDAS